ncbi:hypothetical protein BpHYR1_002198 [Brachionus plicatilis]|uniref:Uncharacterized protein n=1 Tax=Brachionus plicatilis TaxID=10195 RepID=A0A3M7R1R6_BRAPC|nr:hypothetical protein BpHYR1_002198 [Brachionus plicatilis]
MKNYILLIDDDEETLSDVEKNLPDGVIEDSGDLKPEQRNIHEFCEKYELSHIKKDNYHFEFEHTKKYQQQPSKNKQSKAAIISIE